MWTGRHAPPSLFFGLAIPAAGDYIGHMSASYGQFCPIAQASEIFATRWTPLIVRELMTGVHSFNDIHRGVPLISRAVLIARLRELERHGVIERRPHGAGGASHEYWLTPAGEGLRVVMHALGQWGITYTDARIKRSDLDPALLIWGLRKRVALSTLPDRRDRKSTRLNSSHVEISYAVFCLKKKNEDMISLTLTTLQLGLFVVACSYFVS